MRQVGALQDGRQPGGGAGARLLPLRASRVVADLASKQVADKAMCTRAGREGNGRTCSPPSEAGGCYWYLWKYQTIPFSCLLKVVFKI